MPSFEYQYKDSLKNFLTLSKRNQIDYIEDRTGTGTLFVPHQYFYLEDVKNQFPLLRGKKVYPYMAYKELIWMLRGRTDVQWLRDHKVTYWDEWEQPDGTIGKSYGYQFRNFNGIDQVQELCDEMTKNPLSRRLIIDLWNVGDMKEMALPPCQFLYQFTCTPVKNVINGNWYHVDVHAIQRSGDSFLGVPYNFLFSSLLLNVICDYCNKRIENINENGTSKNLYIPKNVHHTVNHYHLYKNHILQAIEYVHNVEENKNGCIDVPTKIELQTGKARFTNIDNYLDEIEYVVGIKESLKVSYEGIDTYGVIKADISI